MNKKISFGRYNDINELNNEKIIKNVVVKNSCIDFSFRKVNITEYLHMFQIYCNIVGYNKYTEKDREIIISLFLVLSIKCVESKLNINKIKCMSNYRLEGKMFKGFVDSIIIDTENNNFLLVNESKKDNFDKGEVQLLLEMYTAKELQVNPIYGLVTNLKVWDFYKYEEHEKNILLIKYESLFFNYEKDNLDTRQIENIMSIIAYIIRIKDYIDSTT